MGGGGGAEERKIRGTKNGRKMRPERVCTG
jgi:hypothetical protein